jgi:hypothetical protein
LVAPKAKIGPGNASSNAFPVFIALFRVFAKSAEGNADKPF